MKRTRKPSAAAELRKELARVGTTPPAEPWPRDVVSWCRRYLPFALSVAWSAVLAALFGIRLEKLEQTVLQKLCGYRVPAPSGYGEGIVIAGRRAGKSIVAACVGLFECIVRGDEHMQWLAPGQRGYVAIISRTQRQALELFRYARSIVERNPELHALLECDPLESQSGGELRFKNGTVLTVMVASRSSIRGYTFLATILDEFAWVAYDEASSDPDIEIVSAARFAMVAPAGAPRRRLLVISSPAAKMGFVYESHRQFYGKSNDLVLVAHGDTFTFNESISPAALESERIRDPQRYRREVEAEFLDSVSPFLDGDLVNAAARDPDAYVFGANRYPGSTTLGPGQYGGHCAAIDLAFKRDSSALAIGRVEEQIDGLPPRYVVCGVWIWTPQPGQPLVVEQVLSQISAICRRYGVNWVACDQFAFQPLQESARRYGIDLHEIPATNQSKVEIFTRLRELLISRRLSLPADERLLRELRELEARVSQSNNIVIGHPMRASAHDDVACAVAWLVYVLGDSVLNGTVESGYIDWNRR